MWTLDLGTTEVRGQVGGVGWWARRCWRGTGRAALLGLDMKRDMDRDREKDREQQTAQLGSSFLKNRVSALCEGCWSGDSLDLGLHGAKML